MEMRKRQQIAVITGASSGIGEALARAMAARGTHVVLAARSTARLEDVAQAIRRAGGVATVLPSDLSKPGAAQHLYDDVTRLGLEVDTLVNNAGFGYHGPFESEALEHLQGQLQVNMVALAELTRLFVPSLLARRGTVLNLASTSAFQPAPYMSVYGATKAFVLSMTESLAEELRGSGVTATALCPGVTATDMLSGAARSHEGLGRLPQAFVGTADSVAAEGYEACLRGETIRVPGRLNLAATLASRAAPKWLVRRLGGAMSRSIA